MSPFFLCIFQYEIKIRQIRKCTEQNIEYLILLYSLQTSTHACTYTQLRCLTDYRGSWCQTGSDSGCSPQYTPASSLCSLDLFLWVLTRASKRPRAGPARASSGQVIAKSQRLRAPEPRRLYFSPPSFSLKEALSPADLP